MGNGFFREKVWPVFAQHGVVGVLLLLFLLAHFGWIPTEQTKARAAAEAMETALKDHEKTSQAVQQTLQNIERILVDQKRIQTQAALIACLKEAKTDPAREDCVKKFGGP